ncbi:MAG: zinc-ribbon domain-containing protein [Candidatus Thorarchaeota archaeon]
MNETAFCPRCQQKVLLTREKIDTCLAVILLIFTGGIGLIIYLAVHYNKPKQHCIHCGTKISTFKNSHPYTYQSQSETQKGLYNTLTNSTEEILGAKPNFCAFCGEKVEAGTKFCQNCGSKII